MSDDKFVEAYDDLMSYMYEFMDDTLHSCADALELAEKKAIEISDMTQDEINHVSQFLLRDIDHAAHYINDEKNPDSLSEWLKFDIELIENFAWDAFSNLADKTRLELNKLESQAKQFKTYQSGEITGPGTFACQDCNKQIAFKSTSTIPECPQCKGKSFNRY